MRKASADLLEFDALKSLLARYVASPGAQRLLDALTPTSDLSHLAPALALTAEAIAYWRASAQPQPAARGAAVRFRFDSLPDFSPHTAKLAIEGALLEAREILELLQALDRACDIRAVLNAVSGRFPLLGACAGRIGDFRPLIEELAGVILPDGTVADSASVALGRIRRDIERQQGLIRESLQRLLRAHREDGVLQEDFITLRNDRFVLPVVAGQQRRLEGVVHGASGSGHTLFIEPFETVALNNELVRLRDEEAREVHRILDSITWRLRQRAVEIRETIDVVSEIEFVFAKARFAADFDCAIPRFSPLERPRLLLREARHPLLEDVLRRQRKSIVPISVELSGPVRTLLISGPNTGGKTVALKTAGLLVLMAQSALPVPAAEMELPHFDEVLADIGDQQSIEQSLSTFSAHLMRIREILAAVTSASLVLIDELGRATDPEEGGALGAAVLDVLRRTGAFTMASTHLAALKIYGATTEGVRNAAMSFDRQTLAPTYVLREGMPGVSAGLEIAARLGLPDYVIEQARARMSEAHRDLARLLKMLEDRLEEAARHSQALQSSQAALDAERAQLARIWEKRESEKLRELERNFEQLVEAFQRRAQETLESITRSAEERRLIARAQRRVAQVRRESREEFRTAVLGATREVPGGQPQTPPPAIAEGARVRLKNVRQPARVLREISGGLIEVQAGFLRMQVPVDDVLEVLPETPASVAPKNVRVMTAPRDRLQMRQLNLIGKRAEEAIQELDKFLDDAVLAGLLEVRIVHGHGMGVLRKAVHEFLGSHPHVESFEAAHQAEGGAGATIAKLRP
jgi:DNA mismatch repair protein MutS2